MSIKEKYSEFDSWIKTQDEKKIKFLIEQDAGWNNEKSPELGVLKDSYYWYKKICEFKNPHKGGYDNKWEDLRPYIFGDKIATIEDIKNHMLDYMSYYEKDIEEKKKEWIELYGNIDEVDSDGFTFEEDQIENENDNGYAGIDEYRKVVSFWKNLDRKKIITIVADEVSDMYEINLDGHRNYWLSRSNVGPLLFSYLYYSGYTKEQMDEDLYNSNDTHDEILEFYPPENFRTFSKEEIDSLFTLFSNRKIVDDERMFDSMINDIIKKFGEDQHFIDKIEVIKTLTINNG